MTIEGGDPVGLFGYAIPGLPYELGGHTGRFGFGITTSFGDVSDLYAEELNEAGDAVPRWRLSPPRRCPSQPEAAPPPGERVRTRLLEVSGAPW